MSADAHQTHRGANPGAIGAGVASVPTVDAAAVLARSLHSECRACGTYTGAYDVEALQARVALLEGLLREVEWAGDTEVDRCPLCERPKLDGHAPGCRFVAALADGG